VSARRGAIRRASARDEDGALRPPAAESARLSEPARLALALQRTAGNQAVGALLHRKVKIGTRWLATNASGQLPAIPAELSNGLEPWVADQVRARAEAMRTDAVTENRTFANATALYQPLFAQVLGPTPDQDVKPSGRDAWSTLFKAVKQSGQVTEVPWTSMKPEDAAGLRDELLACPIQRSSNTRTTACHGNTHHKLPKRVTVPGGRALDELPAHEQPAHTPYYEFLIKGHKTTTGIERGILDRDSGHIYISAHYTEGSFAWLSGAPAEIAADWGAKVVEYWGELGYAPAH
jgi:hypothetical protein